MRIAHIITRMIVGGAQENTLFTCQDLLSDWGDDVLLITGPSPGPEGSLMEQRRDHAVPTHLIDHLQRAIHPWHDARAFGQLKSVLREFRPEVVHTHSAKGGFLGRMAAHSVGVPAIIHTVHGAPFHPYQPAVARELFRRCEQFAARRCHRLVSVADAMTEQLVAAGVAPREKFITVYSGMDVEPFLHADQNRSAMRRQLGFADKHVVIGKIARLFHLKGHADVLNAAAKVVKAVPEVRFLFVGDGILRSALEQQIRRSGLEHAVHFAGLVSPAEIPAYISAMDVLVHASLREGLARALPQALIAEKPVVSYDVDGAREVVLCGETGFLIPPRDAQQMADRLIQLARTPPLRLQFGRTGRQRFTEQFRHQHMTEQLRMLYQRVLDRSTGFYRSRPPAPG